MAWKLKKTAQIKEYEHSSRKVNTEFAFSHKNRMEADSEHSPVGLKPFQAFPCST